MVVAPGPLVSPANKATVALHEFVQVLSLERIGLEREVLVGAQVVDPELLCPGRFARRLLIEEEDVDFHTF